MKKKIIKVGKLEEPCDFKYPYFIQLEWYQGAPLVTQPLSEQDLLRLFNQLIAEHNSQIKVELNVK